MLTLAIQAGGQSSRMGQDKALLPFLGKPLIQRVIERLAPLAGEIIVTTNQPEQYAFLDLPLYPDIFPGRGALGGLYTALSAASHPLVAVVACDMPFASPKLTAYLRDVLEDEKVDVAIPKTDDGYEPLHAIYRRETCLPAIENAIRAKRWKMISWFGDVRVRDVLPAEIAPYDPNGRAFANVNTPDEFASAESAALADD